MCQCFHWYAIELGLSWWLAVVRTSAGVHIYIWKRYLFPPFLKMIFPPLLRIFKNPYRALFCFNSHLFCTYFTYTSYFPFPFLLSSFFFPLPFSLIFSSFSLPLFIFFLPNDFGCYFPRGIFQYIDPCTSMLLIWIRIKCFPWIRNRLLDPATAL